MQGEHRAWSGPARMAVSPLADNSIGPEHKGDGENNGFDGDEAHSSRPISNPDKKPIALSERDI